MYSVFLDTEYKDRGGDIFLIGLRTSHGEEYSLHGANLRWNVLSKILKNKKYIFVYGPDIGKLEKQFGVDIKSRWHCINVYSIVRSCLSDLKSKKLIDIERFMGIYRHTASYKKYTRNLDTHWQDPRKRAGIIKYNMEDVLYLELVYNVLIKYFDFDPDNFRILPKK